MSSKILKVLSNVVQTLTDGQKKQARENIGAISGLSTTYQHTFFESQVRLVNNDRYRRFNTQFGESIQIEEGTKVAFISLHAGGWCKFTPTGIGDYVEISFDLIDYNGTTSFLQLCSIHLHNEDDDREFPVTAVWTNPTPGSYWIGASTSRVISEGEEFYANLGNSGIVNINCILEKQ